MEFLSSNSLTADVLLHFLYYLLVRGFFFFFASPYELSS